jgi:hypothetical protein
MVCDDLGRAATWRQSIRAPRPVPAFPLSGPPPVTGLGGRLPDVAGGGRPIVGVTAGPPSPNREVQTALCGAGQENILAEAPGEQSHVGEVPARGPVE